MPLNSCAQQPRGADGGLACGAGWGSGFPLCEVIGRLWVQLAAMQGSPGYHASHLVASGLRGIPRCDDLEDLMPQLRRQVGNVGCGAAAAQVAAPVAAPGAAPGPVTACGQCVARI